MSSSQAPTAVPTMSKTRSASETPARQTNFADLLKHAKTERDNADKPVAEGPPSTSEEVEAPEETPERPSVSVATGGSSDPETAAVAEIAIPSAIALNDLATEEDRPKHSTKRGGTASAPLTPDVSEGRAQSKTSHGDPKASPAFHSDSGHLSSTAAPSDVVKAFAPGDALPSVQSVLVRALLELSHGLNRVAESHPQRPIALKSAGPSEGPLTPMSPKSDSTPVVADSVVKSSVQDEGDTTPEAIDRSSKVTLAAEIGTEPADHSFAFSPSDTKAGPVGTSFRFSLQDDVVKLPPGIGGAAVDEAVRLSAMADQSNFNTPSSPMIRHLEVSVSDSVLGSVGVRAEMRSGALHAVISGGRELGAVAPELQKYLQQHDVTLHTVRFTATAATEGRTQVTTAASGSFSGPMNSPSSDHRDGQQKNGRPRPRDWKSGARARQDDLDNRHSGITSRVSADVAYAGTTLSIHI